MSSTEAGHATVVIRAGASYCYIKPAKTCDSIKLLKVS